MTPNNPNSRKAAAGYFAPRRFWRVVLFVLFWSWAVLMALGMVFNRAIPTAPFHRGALLFGVTLGLVMALVSFRLLFRERVTASKGMRWLQLLLFPTTIVAWPVLMYLAILLGVPVVVQPFAKTPYSQVVTVVDKFEGHSHACPYGIDVAEFDIPISRGLCVDQPFWDQVRVGDHVLIKGTDNAVAVYVKQLRILPPPAPPQDNQPRRSPFRRLPGTIAI
ncbi:MAG: hypothetical protein P8Y64_04505 [Gammaproteobacteria bacterium]